MRRHALFALLAATTPLFAACSSPDESNPPEVKALPGPTEWNRDVTPPTDDEAQTQRSACAYKAGSLPAETQGESHPQGADIPVDHIVVLMLENRSFDHYFQKLPEYGQPDVEVAPATYTNPDTNGMPVAPFHDTFHCFVDTNHEWSGVHEQANGGAMDGFVVTNEGWHEVPVNGTLDLLSGNRAMGYYDHTDLPFYYWLANEFSIADHYHSSLLGPTFPNRMYLYAASSYGYVKNSLVSEKTVIFDYLEQREIDWKIYSSTTPGFAIFVDKMLKYQADHLATIDDYFADAAAGKLPSVAFVDPAIGREGPTQNDEHPPAVEAIGQEFSAQVIESLTKSPNWSRSALFLTYDEHGGLFDHVNPPPACAPDDFAPELDPGDPQANFDQYGVRVPMMVVSPYAKKHFVSHRTYDHTSIVRFIEARYVMPALTNRDANAEAPWEMFDFDAPPHKDPPAISLPSIPQDIVNQCAYLYGE